MARATTRPAVLGYARVSTEGQAENGVSLDEQRHRLKSYCAAHGLKLLRVEVDAGISAKRTANRPALQSALAALKKGEATGLVSIKLDRVSRTTRDVLDLVVRAEREGWALHSIEERLDTSSPQGRFVVTVLAAIAQLEREQAGSRTRAALGELKRQGFRVSGKAQFGFRFKGDHVVENAVEQRLLKKVLRLRAKGYGAMRIMQSLNARGEKHPRTRREWRIGSVVAILRTLARQGKDPGRRSGNGA